MNRGQRIGGEGEGKEWSIKRRERERREGVSIIKQEAFEKCWVHSLLRAVLHCHSPGVATAATVARRLRIDVHDDDDDNDNDNA